MSDVRQWVSLGAPELVGRALAGAAGDPVADVAAFRERLKARAASPADVFPGVISCLEALKARGFGLGVVTNKVEAIAARVLGEAGLNRFFEVLIGGDTLPVAKPDPAPLREALHRLGSPERAAFVGDSIVDATACERASLPFYLFSGGYGAAECAGSPVRIRFATYEALTSAIVGDFGLATIALAAVE